jgi:hypothetical protein
MVWPACDAVPYLSKTLYREFVDDSGTQGLAQLASVLSRGQMFQEDVEA